MINTKTNQVRVEPIKNKLGYQISGFDIDKTIILTQNRRELAKKYFNLDENMIIIQKTIIKNGFGNKSRLKYIIQIAISRLVFNTEGNPNIDYYEDDKKIVYVSALPKKILKNLNEKQIKKSIANYYYEYIMKRKIEEQWDNDNENTFYQNVSESNIDQQNSQFIVEQNEDEKYNIFESIEQYCNYLDKEDSVGTLSDYSLQSNIDKISKMEIYQYLFWDIKCFKEQINLMKVKQKQLEKNQQQIEKEQNEHKKYSLLIQFNRNISLYQQKIDQKLKNKHLLIKCKQKLTNIISNIRKNQYQILFNIYDISSSHKLSRQQKIIQYNYLLTLQMLPQELKLLIQTKIQKLQKQLQIKSNISLFPVNENQKDLRLYLNLILQTRQKQIIEAIQNQQLSQLDIFLSENQCPTLSPKKTIVYEYPNGNILKWDQLKKKITMSYKDDSTVQIPLRENGEFQDQAIYNYKNGDRYEGGWKDNMPNGQGKQFIINEETKKLYLVYQGQFLNGQKHGYGIYYYSNGNKLYEGNFFLGQKKGLGTQYDSYGNIIYNGVWQNDQIKTQAESEYDPGLNVIISGD